ncbi:MAG: hypothetical protein HY958_01545 [Bacteroidia bacterium]|nr:hypothetical protein [Bacteroidia bacterium]
MLEYTKMVLQKVSFDKFLFANELKKSLKWLQSSEILALHAWAIATFAMYSDVIKDVFDKMK